MTNKTIAMAISDIEKSSKEFKKTHKVKVSGPYDDEDMPKWFKKWSEEVYQNVPPQWFKKWSEEVYQKVPPQWFKDWEKNVFQKIVKKNNLKL